MLIEPFISSSLKYLSLNSFNIFTSLKRLQIPIMSSYQRRTFTNSNHNGGNNNSGNQFAPGQPTDRIHAPQHSTYSRPNPRQRGHQEDDNNNEHEPYQGARRGGGFGGGSASGNGGGGSNRGGGGFQPQNYRPQQFNKRPYSTGSSRRIANFSHGHQQPQHQQRSPKKNQKAQPHPPRPEDTLAYYNFDTVGREQLLALDIYPTILDDLLSPGKGVCYLTQIITVADNQFKNVGTIKFDSKSVEGFWIGFLTINFPEPKTFTCKHTNKKECKNLCSLAAVYHLRKINSVDPKLKLNIDTSLTNSFIDNSRGPITLTPIPMSIKQQMMSFTNKFDEVISNLIEYQIDNARIKYERYDVGGIEEKHMAILEGLEPDEGVVTSDTNVDKSSDPIPTQGSGLIDVFTSRPYTVPEPRKKAHAFTQLRKVYELKNRKLNQRDDSNFSRIITNQGKLPIRTLKDTILEALQNNRAIVIAGDTGSGKSTQVPQFILENYIKDETNSNNFANIAITQPRRISAISLAERVAVELGENSAGRTVGHNVRFDSKQPERDLNIMTFFTTGMLLKKIQRNPDLKGVSHLIIDEVHERDCTTDFLLILIKRLLTRRKDLRVIFMSASMDASLFAKYFDNCPIISVAGRCYPVENLYLEDICHDLRVANPREEARERAPKLNLNILKELLMHIDETREDGAILCFMPGWKEMKAMQKELEFCRSRNQLKVLLAHSKLPIHEQRLIFDHSRDGERKIILATNIAETSITIDDVRYVVDTGLCNSIDYDPDLNISTFGTRWISRANAKQRSGRAGRTSSGQCFKLYSREEESYFQEFPFPELLRIPLESVIMEVKCHCPNEKAAIFLSQAIQHPSISAIHNALEELLSLGVLDEKENLTTLGKRVSDFSTHPRLSVSLVVAAALRCFYPVLNASAILSSTQEPFVSAMNDKSRIRETKQKLCTEAVCSNRDPINYMSDHIAFGNLLAQYDNASMSKHELDYFSEENCLNRSAMHNIQDCRNLYANMMMTSKFIADYEWYSYDSFPNRNMNDLELVIASLTYSFYPKVVRIIRGLVKGGRMYPNKVAPTDTQTNTRVRFASDSIVRNISLGKQLNSVIKEEGGDSDEDSDYLSMSELAEDRKPTFITYLNSRVDQESNQIVIRDGSVTPVLTLLIFGGRELSIYDSGSRNNANDVNSHDTNNMVNITLDRHNLLTFRVSRDDALAIQEWRQVWQKYLNWYIHTKNTNEPVNSNDSIIATTMNEFLELNKKLYASLK